MILAIVLSFITGIASTSIVNNADAVEPVFLKGPIGEGLELIGQGITGLDTRLDDISSQTSDIGETTDDILFLSQTSAPKLDQIALLRTQVERLLNEIAELPEPLSQLKARVVSFNEPTDTIKVSTNDRLLVHFCGSSGDVEGSPSQDSLIAVVIQPNIAGPKFFNYENGNENWCFTVGSELGDIEFTLVRGHSMLATITALTTPSADPISIAFQS